jgi:hypothetical protein
MKKQTDVGRSSLDNSVCEVSYSSPERRSGNLMSMKPRHSAALALVGWYLMAPPFDRVTLTFRNDVPVSEWDNLDAVHLHWEGEFDSKNECEEFKKTQTLAFLLNPESGDGVQPQQFMLGECIASNDPRLLGK